MKKYARQWGLLVIPLAAVFAGEDAGATSILLEQEESKKHVSFSSHEVPLGKVFRLDLPEGTPLLLPQVSTLDWTVSNETRQVNFGTLPDREPLSPFPSEGGNHRKSAPTNYLSVLPSVGAGELSSWKNFAEADDWLFRLQFTRVFDYEEPEPLIPIPEPTGATLVVLGITSLVIRKEVHRALGGAVPLA